MSDPIRVGPSMTGVDKLREEERKWAIQARATAWAKTQLKIDDIVKDNDRLKQGRAELIACLKEILTMQCETASGHLDSMGDSAYAEALRLLDKLGVVEIVGEDSNRCIIARWKE